MNDKAVISLLKYTGERVIPEKMKPTNPMLLEHTARYYFATPYCHGRVLDIACGSGYGTHMIAKMCKQNIEQVVGVDIDPDTIRYAKHTYYHPLSTFEVGDVLDKDLPKRIGLFDTIVSFETIEHVPNDEEFIVSLLHMLKSDGKLIISTPFGAGRGIPSQEPFHVHQLTEDQFKELLQSHFEHVEMYYQRGVTIEPPREGLYYPLGVAICSQPRNPRSS